LKPDRLPTGRREAASSIARKDVLATTSNPLRDRVAHLVRSLRTCARIRSLTTGTFNLIVKDRIALRLSGAHSVQPDTQLVRVQPSSKPYKHTVQLKTLSIRASHRISTGFPHWDDGGAGSFFWMPFWSLRG